MKKGEKNDKKNIPLASKYFLILKNEY